MDQERRILFVCERGWAKSVVAAFHFDKRACERRVPVRANSRGTHPDVEIAPNAVHGLATQEFTDRSRKAVGVPAL